MQSQKSDSKKFRTPGIIPLAATAHNNMKIIVVFSCSFSFPGHFDKICDSKYKPRHMNNIAFFSFCVLRFHPSRLQNRTFMHFISSFFFLCFLVSIKTGALNGICLVSRVEMILCEKQVYRLQMMKENRKDWNLSSLNLQI